MTWVNLKKIERYLETTILRIVLEPGTHQGCYKRDITTFFRTWAGVNRERLRKECPGWFQLAEPKRGARLNKIIEKLVREKRLRMEKTSLGTRLVPLDVFDKLVNALMADGSEDQEHSP